MVLKVIRLTKVLMVEAVSQLIKHAWAPPGIKHEAGHCASRHERGAIFPALPQSLSTDGKYRY